MGLGLSTRAERRSKAELLAAFHSAIQNTPLAPVATSAPLDGDGEGFVYFLHPAEEPVFVELHSDHAAISAKTSSAGPGYHAFLVSLLDDVEKRLGLSWQWTGADDSEDVFDETGYALSRDFEKLQQDMAAFFKTLLTHLDNDIRAKGYTGLRISMPVEFDPESGDNETLTQLGPLTDGEIAAQAALSGEAFAEAARRYFPWWEEGFGTNFYHGMALNALWMTVSWSAPADENERGEMARVLQWCEKAAQGGACLPLEAVGELRRLAASQEAPRLPLGDGIEYRRRFMRHALTGGWSLAVPGALKASLEDDGETAVFCNGELEVKGSTLTARRRAGAPVPAGMADKLTKRIEVSPAASGAGTVLQVTAQQLSDSGVDHFCIVTIWMEHEGLRPAADKIAELIRFSPPRAG